LPTYALHLMGPPRLVIDGAEVHINRRKAMALLAYLAVDDRPHSRDALATLLWPESDASTARGELRRRLSQVNRMLGGDGIDADRWNVSLNPDLGLRLDVAVFRALLAQTDGHSHPPMEACPDCAPQLNDAVALYTDGFMAGFSLEDSAAFDDWQFFEAEALKDEFASALVRLATYYTSQGDFDLAIDYARRWLAVDPLHEPAHRHLMVLYARSNQRAAALRQFETCQRVLQEELGAEPSERTREIYDRVLGGETPLAPSAVEAILERELRSVGPCPYRGLAAFREEDAPFFHGREAFVERLASAVSTQPLVAMIVGASGSGKSSVIYAGLMPRLREEGGWAITDLRPGRDPFHALATALSPLVEPDLAATDRMLQTRKLAAALADGTLPLMDVVQQVAGRSRTRRRLLLLVDQFEELYTLCPDAGIRRAFIDLLLAAVDAASESEDFTLLVTLRADFMGQALAHRPMADALQDASQLLGPMTRDELRDAIEKPAAAQGAAFEAGLVERLLDDVADEPGHLPLLEFALTLLWERLDFGWLTHAAYEQIGRVEGALARYAQQVYDGLPEEDQLLCRRVFTQLVQPGEGTEDTRRVASRSEIGEDAWPLVQHLANQRLVVTGRDELSGTETVEVVHEALITNWDQLQAWMAEDRAFRTWQERLRVALRTWEDSDRDEGALLRGAPLAEAEGWITDRSGEVSSSEREFVQAGIELRERRAHERDRRRRRTVAGLTIGLLAAIVLTAITLLLRRQSRQQAAVLLAGQAETELANGFHDRAVLLGLAALEQYPYVPQAEHALARAVSYSRALQEYTEHETAVTSVAWSPDGTRAASSSTGNRVDIWDPATGRQLAQIDLPEGMTGNVYDQALNVKWTPDGGQLLVVTGDRYTLGSQDHSLSLWDVATGEMVAAHKVANAAEPESGDTGASWVNYPTGSAAAVSPRTGRLATLGGDDTAILWDEAWKQPTLALRGHSGGVNCVGWSPDEAKLVTGGMDGLAMVWDTATGVTIAGLTSHDGRVTAANWAPDGTALATGDEHGTLRLWSTDQYTLTHIIATEAGLVGSLAWAPNGSRLVSGHEDGSLRFWDAADGSLVEVLRGHNGGVNDLDWSPTDNRLVSADASGSIRTWNAAQSTAWRLYPPQEQQGGLWSAQAVDWSSDGRSVVVGGGHFAGEGSPPSLAIWELEENQLAKESLGDKLGLVASWTLLSPDDSAILYVGFKGFPDFSDTISAHVFDVETEEIIRTLTPDGTSLIRSAAWSPDGSQVATGYWSGELDIWDYRSEQMIKHLVHNTEGMGVTGTEWSPDGSRFAAGGDNGQIIVYDALTWEQVYGVAHESPAYINGVTWSPDGTRLLTVGGNEEEGARDNDAHLWDARTGAELLVFEGHTKQTWPGGWSPDGARVATWGDEGTVKVWEEATGDELLTIDVPVLYGGGATWSPDGKHVATFGTDTLISVWRVWESTEELLEYAKACCVYRDLTSAERSQFGLTE